MALALRERAYAASALLLLLLCLTAPARADPPSFAVDPVYPSVAETAFWSTGPAVGRTIVTIEANSNTDVTYALSPPSTVFTINETTGVISNLVLLDYEAGSSYTLTATATNLDGDVRMFFSFILLILSPTHPTHTTIAVRAGERDH
jgi:hypothetical protein